MIIKNKKTLLLLAIMVSQFPTYAGFSVYFPFNSRKKMQESLSKNALSPMNHSLQEGVEKTGLIDQVLSEPRKEKTEIQKVINTSEPLPTSVSALSKITTDPVISENHEVSLEQVQELQNKINEVKEEVLEEVPPSSPLYNKVKMFFANKKLMLMIALTGAYFVIDYFFPGAPKELILKIVYGLKDYAIALKDYVGVRVGDYVNAHVRAPLNLWEGTKDFYNEATNFKDMAQGFQGWLTKGKNLATIGFSGLAKPIFYLKNNYNFYNFIKDKFSKGGENLTKKDRKEVQSL